MRLGRNRIGFVCAVVLAAAVTTGCSYSQLTAAGSLVPATPTQFQSPVSVTVSQGSTVGQEISAGQQFWWLNGQLAQLTVTNNTDSPKVVTILATVKVPPCMDAVSAVFAPPTGSTVTVNASGAGGQLLLPVNLDANESEAVPISITGPGCRVAKDPRTFFAGLFSLRTQSS